MSLSLTLKEAIDNVVQEYINRVSEKYKIESTELSSLWYGEDVKLNKSPVKNPVKKPVKTKVESKVDSESLTDIDTEISPEMLAKCNKDALKELCKKHGHKCSGTKAVLISRLLGKEEETPKKTTAKKTTAKKTTKKSAKEKVEEKPVIKKLVATSTNVPIRRNQFDNYEHPDSGLVFDPESKEAVGKQQDDGSIEPLSVEDIDLCNKYKFKYRLPENLDKKTSLNDVTVQELDEETKDDESEAEELVDEEELEDEVLIVDEDDEDDEYEEFYEEVEETE